MKPNSTAIHASVCALIFLITLEIMLYVGKATPFLLGNTILFFVLTILFSLPDEN